MTFWPVSDGSGESAVTDVEVDAALTVWFSTALGALAWKFASPW